jgi:hypothetical protein
MNEKKSFCFEMIEIVNLIQTIPKKMKIVFTSLFIRIFSFKLFITDQ